MLYTLIILAAARHCIRRPTRTVTVTQTVTETIYTSASPTTEPIDPTETVFETEIVTVEPESTKSAWESLESLLETMESEAVSENDYPEETQVEDALGYLYNIPHVR